MTIKQPKNRPKKSALHMHKWPSRRRGGALVIALVTLLVITSTMAALVHSLTAEFRQSRQTALELQAHCLADAALARAAAQLRTNPSYQGETWRAAAANP